MRGGAGGEDEERSAEEAKSIRWRGVYLRHDSCAVKGAAERETSR